MAQAGHPVKCTNGYRSLEKQAYLYAKGRTTPGPKVTNAKPGESAHNYGVGNNALARDYAFLTKGNKVTYDGPWLIFGYNAKKCGLKWGGSFKKLLDRPHVEWPNWKQFK